MAIQNIPALGANDQ